MTNKQPLIIRNGLFFDGSGAKGKVTDLLIEDGKVEQIGNIANIEQAEEIDAQGNWVCPGFLDIHTHYDAEVEVMPGLEESIRHGVTTVVFGNCSISSAVGKDEHIVDLFARVENMPAKILKDWIKDRITWKSVGEYYEHLEQVAIGPNVATFLGHSNLRIEAMGLDRSLKVRKASAEELKRMENVLAEAVEAGYLGMSIDMLPFHRMAGEYAKDFKGVSVPSQQAHPSEYRRLANILRQHGRVLQATPNAMDKRSVLRLLQMSSGWMRRPLRTTIVAALDTKSDKKIHRLATALADISNGMLKANVRWQALAEPFLNYSDGPITPLFEEFPSAVQAIGASTEERREMFADPHFRRWFRKDWTHRGAAVFHRRLDDMWVIDSPDASQVGKNFAQIAEEVGKDPLEHFMDLMAKYDTNLRWKSSVANHRDKQRVRLLAHKTTLPGFNDSGAHNVNMAFQDGALQTLKQAQENPDILPIEQAIYRMTKMTADWLGFDAGYLQVGKRADICIINPQKLATGLSEAIEHYDERLKGAMRMVKRSDGVVSKVLVNGEVLYDGQGFHSELGQKRFGKLLRSTHR